MNKVIFWFTLTRKLQFLTIERIKKSKKDTALWTTRNVLVCYKSKEMRVKDIYVDPEFAPMRNKLLGLGATIYVVSAYEHVVGVERKTRVLKEQGRADGVSFPAASCQY